MQFFLPENWFTVRRALLDAGRADLIGEGPRCLIPSTPPPEALEARRRAAERLARQPSDEEAAAAADPASDATHVHAPDAGTKPTVGYRPGRKGARRR
jgi:hypothetical protein